ncbi:hypothetical protein [Pedococcus sp. P5_B7]
MYRFTASRLRRPSRGSAALAAASLVLAMGALTATAGQAGAAPAPVDPATLTPAPPDFFNATCTHNGVGITCDLHFTEVVLDHEPNGVVCDTPAGPVELIETNTRSVVGKRFYDRDGLLLRRHFRDEWAGTMTNPVSDRSVTYAQADRILHDLAVPGDNTTGTEEMTTRLRVVNDAGSTIFVDAGRTVIREADGTIEFQAGPHRFDDYFVNGDAAAIAPLCAALT